MGLIRLIFNFYLVFKNCWPIILFHTIGFIALNGLDQGRDVMREMGFFSIHPKDQQHTWMLWLAVCWWGWQSWRAARIILHFSNYNSFIHNPTRILTAQIHVPRILAMVPFIIVSFAIYQTHNSFHPLIGFFISTGIWIYTFFHFRRDLTIWLRSNRPNIKLLIPEYVQAKNEVYTAAFIWKKQWKWILVRLGLVMLLFFLFTLYPINMGDSLGSTSVVIFALGSWLVISSFIMLTEKFVRIPLVFLVVLLPPIFSFFNNNHEIRTTNNSSLPLVRPDLDYHFTQWIEDKKQQGLDTIPVLLVASEGGGIRAAYWTAGILGYIQDKYPEIGNNLYGFSGVSGGALGEAVFQALKCNASDSVHHYSKQILSNDFLSPVTSWALFPDLLQRFVPVPIEEVDRARALEYSWEHTWNKYLSHKPYPNRFKEGYLSMHKSTPFKHAVMIMNATHVETGKRVLISNVKTNDHIFQNSSDLFNISGRDIPLSTAVSISSRFPYLTPPARVSNIKGEPWGDLVDGGYIDNLGVTTILELYTELKNIADRKNFKVKFQIVLIKNSKSFESEKPLPGLYESLSPLFTFAQVWQKSGQFNLDNTKNYLLKDADEIHLCALQRTDKDLLPLGWYLSANARKIIDQQVEFQAESLVFDLKKKEN